MAIANLVSDHSATRRANDTRPGVQNGTFDCTRVASMMWSMTLKLHIKKLFLALVLTLTAGVALASSPASAGDSRWNYTNGCTLSPDGVPGLYNFRDICNLHDVCYARYSNGSHQYGTTESGRSTCDGLFLSNMTQYCNARFPWYDGRRGYCLGVAWTYYSAVRNFGSSFYYDWNTKW